MRRISATYIFTNNSAPLRNGIIVCQNNGTIVEVIDTKGKLTEQAGLEYYNGIICPGFVNTHCHLELSSFKEKIPKHRGLAGFLGHVNQLRKSDTGTQIQKIKQADIQLRDNGTVAVADISNSDLSVPIKKESPIYYYTFVETFGFIPTRAEKAFTIAKQVQKKFQKNNLPASITPHSPYSVSEPLFQKIKNESEQNNTILSVHNQESQGENELFTKGTGHIANHFKNNLGLDISHWKPTGKNSLASVSHFFPINNALLLVHNTYTTEIDIEQLKKIRSLSNTFFVLCPNANLYIENQLPDIKLFIEKGLSICIGTDSLASNTQLSVLEEIKTLQAFSPDLELETLLKWACLNGAKALGIFKNFGSFEKGKKPGINLISGADLHQLKLTNKSKVKPLA